MAAMRQAEISRGKAKRIPRKLLVCSPLEEQGSWKMHVTFFIFKLVVTFVQAPMFPIEVNSDLFTASPKLFPLYSVTSNSFKCHSIVLGRTRF